MQLSTFFFLLTIIAMVCLKILFQQFCILFQPFYVNYCCIIKLHNNYNLNIGCNTTY